MVNQSDVFEKWYEDCLTEREYYLNWGGKLFNEALKGAAEGDTIFIAGGANQGKSMLLTSSILNLLTLNDDTVVIDFSVDDSRRKRITQYTANLANLAMNDIAFAHKALGPIEMDKFDGAAEKVKQWIKNERLFIFEATDTTDSGEIILQASTSFISKMVSIIRKQVPDKKIIVAIDSLNDVDLNTGQKIYSELGEEKAMVEEIQRVITRNKCLLLATSHLRKNSGRRPTLEDIKGNSFLGYAAKVAIGIFNDMKVNKEKANIVWMAGQTKMPIIEAHFLKSKVSDFNGVICMKQWPSRGKVEEPVEEAAQKTLQNMVYEAV